MAEFASSGIGNAGLATGIIGTSLGVLNGLNGLGGLGGILGGGTAGNAPVNRYELGLLQEITAKDAKIGLLEADKYTDEKLTEVYKDLNGQISALREAQNAVNTQQAVFNGTVNGTIGCIQAQVAQLMGLTKLVVPNTSVCPGWGNVTITPAAATTTTPAA